MVIFDVQDRYLVETIRVAPPPRDYSYMKLGNTSTSVPISVLGFLNVTILKEYTGTDVKYV